MLEIALACISRGWHVFPCWPESKQPMTKNGWHAATLDEAQVRAWWTRSPNANVAIACAPSNLCVVDIDKGLTEVEDFDSWAIDLHMPPTFIVRTGRRPGVGLQLYFTGQMRDIGGFTLNGLSGDVKSAGGYVMAAGSIHPDSKEKYAIIYEPDELAPIPDEILNLKRPEAPKDDGAPITSNRNVALTSIAGKLRNAGLSAEALEVALLQVNADRCAPPLEEEEVKQIASHAANWALPEVEPIAVLGGKVASEPVKDWRTRYMTEETYKNVKPPEFLIDGFLVKRSIAMLAGPVAQRKSIIALNIAHALCTGTPLFGYFDVTGGHDRVVYLCPEMGAASFVKRIKQIGLGQYIGKTLFVQTMSEDSTALDELDGELPGAVVIVDTITRFIEGDENKSEDMRKFAHKVFRLVNAGATVVLLHHSKKGSSGSLDDGLRGSSELAAFVDSCWVTELGDPKKPYESLSKMRNVKQRDFESDPFKIKPAPGSYYLAMDGEPGPEAVLNGRANDASTAALKKLLVSDPKIGINRLQKALKALGHRKGGAWITQERARLTTGAGITLTE